MSPVHLPLPYRQHISTLSKTPGTLANVFRFIGDGTSGSHFGPDWLHLLQPFTFHFPLDLGVISLLQCSQFENTYHILGYFFFHIFQLLLIWYDLYDYFLLKYISNHFGA